MAWSILGLGKEVKVDHYFCGSSEAWLSNELWQWPQTWRGVGRFEDGEEQPVEMLEFSGLLTAGMREKEGWNLSLVFARATREEGISFTKSGKTGGKAGRNRIRRFLFFYFLGEAEFEIHSELSGWVVNLEFGRKDEELKRQQWGLQKVGKCFKTGKQ